MVVPRKKVSFEKIKKLIKSIDTTSGAFLLWDPAKKKTLKEHIFKATLTRNIVLFTFLMISTLIVTNFKLISIILCSSVALTLFGLCTCMFLLLHNKHVLKNLLKWCKNLYDVEKKYHEVIHRLAETELIKIERRTTTFLKWLKIILYVDTMGFLTIGLLLPENIHPRFTSPVPFYLPFENQKTWFSFGCTMLLETIIVIDISTITIFLYGFAITFFIHFLGYLDIIQKTAEMMKEDVLTKPAKKLLSFDVWIKLLNEMICDVNSVIVSAEKIYTIPFLINELAGLCSFFICGLLFTVVRDQYFFAIGMTIGSLLLFVICFINEKILEKIEDIQTTLYDMPWYDLTNNQQKSLMILMHCDKLQKGFTAGKVHHLTFERFGIIVKAGYTNLLILKDLVQK